MATLGGHLKGAVNVPMGDKAALRAVGYDTEYAGFIDALRRRRRRRRQRRRALRRPRSRSPSSRPTDVTITPRVVYQKVETDGFNRQEVFNLYANRFTTTRPPVTFGERQQYLLLREEFRTRRCSPT